MMKYFTMGELTRSTTADARGIDNRCDLTAAENLKNLVEQVLDPVREWYGKPVLVNSGFRSPALNRAVGGVPSSQHVKGEAADITAGSKEENRLLFDYIRENLPFDQLINEKDLSWIHVSLKRHGRNRHELLNL